MRLEKLSEARHIVVLLVIVMLTMLGNVPL